MKGNYQMKLKFIHKAKRIFITISSLSIIAAISIAVASSASAATHFTSYTPTVYDANGCGSNSSLLEAGSSNYSGHCQINKQVFTYKNFAKRYPRLDYMHKGA